MLSETFNHMASQLEVSLKAMLYKERVTKELELAAKIQKDILPKKMPSIPGWDIAAGIAPAAEIGGDCYDCISIDPENHFLYIGDVTGHGVPSGIVVSIASALLYSFAGTKNMKQILSNVNNVLKVKTSANMFMTLLMLQFGENGTEVKYVSAGHPQMVVYQKATGKVITAPGGGIALGMVPDVTKILQESTVELSSGDCVVLYSDGITEASNVAATEMYGIGRLKRAVGEYATLPSAEALKVALLADVSEFVGPGKQNDDITMVVLKKV